MTAMRSHSGSLDSFAWFRLLSPFSAKSVVPVCDMLDVLDTGRGRDVLSRVLLGLEVRHSIDSCGNFSCYRSLHLITFGLLSSVILSACCSSRSSWLLGSCGSEALALGQNCLSLLLSHFFDLLSPGFLVIQRHVALV